MEFDRSLQPNVIGMEQINVDLTENMFIFKDKGNLSSFLFFKADTNLK